MGIPVISLVAYSGSGKTSFLEKLIPELKKRGLRVAVVKHDAHDFDIDRDGKDSARISKAGADVTAIVSASRAAIMENRSVDFAEIVSRIKDVDLIITEGGKHENWPKIMLYRAAAGKEYAARPEDCIAVVSDVEIENAAASFGLEDAAGLADFLLRWLD
jgi:molybdopterin-guanine dinucleotide biosynthesis protein A/molybdopterin-guanine dinucleotide biosynthesis protein